MAAAITKNIATVRRALDNVIFTVTGIPVNDSTEYDANAYPTESALVYRFFFDSPGATTQYDMTSQAFSPKADGSFAHLPVVFPVAGAWNAIVRDQDDNDIATLAFTVT
jgi:hypothetical protein